MGERGGGGTPDTGTDSDRGGGGREFIEGRGEMGGIVPAGLRREPPVMERFGFAVGIGGSYAFTVGGLYGGTEGGFWFEGGSGGALGVDFNGVAAVSAAG